MITLKLIGIAVVLVLSLKIVMSQGMLLERLGAYFERKTDEGVKWVDLIYCQWCMGTVASIVAHFFAFGLAIIPFAWDWQLLIRYPLIVGATSIIAGNLWNLYLTINAIKEHYETETRYLKSLLANEDERSEG